MPLISDITYNNRLQRVHLLVRLFSCFVFLNLLKPQKCVKVFRDPRNNFLMDNHIKEKTLELESKPEFIYGCTCPESSLENATLSAHKKRILNTVAITENYLRDRRIPELIRFLLSKVLAQESDKPILYLEKLLDDCILFRAGVGPAPLLFEDRHLDAVVKSFDPGHRGWLTAGQIHRLYATLGLSIKEELPNIMPCEAVINNVKVAQENELYDLLLVRPTRNSSDNILV